MLPLLNAGRVELLEHQRLATQLVALERRTSRTGRDLISHPPGGHDDLAVAVCGAATLVAGGRKPLVFTAEFVAEVKRLSFNSSYARRERARMYGL